MTDGRVAALDAAREKFEFFLFEMAEAIAQLKQEIASFNRPDLLPLDFTFESLDRLERAYDLVLDGKVESAVDADTFATRLARYLGETVRKQIGGTWDLAKEPKDINFGKPCVTRIPGLPKTYRFFPLVVVAGYRTGRRPGWMRRRAEQHDIVRSRERFARFLEEMPEELAALQGYMESAASSEAPPSDPSAESLDGLERLLATVLDGAREPPPGGVDRLTEMIARYMGEVYRRQTDADWELCENPRDIDFGLARLGFFSPMQVVENFRVRGKEGLLRDATEGAINASRELAPTRR